MANSSEVLEPQEVAIAIQDKFLGRAETSDICLQKISSLRLSRSAPAAGGHFLEHELVMLCDKQDVVQRRANGRVSYHEEQRDVTMFSEEVREMLQLVPIGYVPLPHQVGGHSYFDGQIGMLRKIGQPSILYKPLQAGSKGPRELTFYDSVFSQEVTSEDTIRLRQLIPAYYGTTVITDRANTPLTCLKLEDITCGFEKPCIIDIKIGKRVWDDLALQDKIDREKKKYPCQEVIGFRIVGMRVYQVTSSTYHFFDRHYGRSLGSEEAVFREGLMLFFNNGNSVRLDLLPLILKQLQPFYDWFESQISYKLFATSLLIVYEGDISLPKQPVIRLVDFAHTYDSNNCLDENFLFGLRKLKSLLESVASKNNDFN